MNLLEGVHSTIWDGAAPEYPQNLLSGSHHAPGGWLNPRSRHRRQSYEGTAAGGANLQARPERGKVVPQFPFQSKRQRSLSRALTPRRVSVGRSSSLGIQVLGSWLTLNLVKNSGFPSHGGNSKSSKCFASLAPHENLGKETWRPWMGSHSTGPQ